MAQSSSQQILARIYGHGRGYVFTPKDFQDIAGSASIRATLTRLVGEGTIRRILRGVYEYPRFSEILQTSAPTDTDAIAQAIARAHGWTITPEGNTALNLLGLSTQVPAQWLYHSDGPSKRVEWDGGRITFKRRANKETTVLSYPTAVLVQALKAMGEAAAATPDALSPLRETLDAKMLSRALREARYVTSWVYAAIKRLAAEKESRHAI